MGILDDIRKENEQKEMCVFINHTKEDFIINKVIEELERIVRSGKYEHRDWDVSTEAAHGCIEAHLGQALFYNGKEEYRLIFDKDYYNWQKGCNNKISDSNIIKITHHPFDKLDENYLKKNLPAKVKTAFGKGVFFIEVNIVELYKVQKKLFSKFNDVIALGKYTVMITFKFRF